MLDAESARGSCVDGGRTIEYDVAYLPYDVAVVILRNQQNTILSPLIRLNDV